MTAMHEREYTAKSTARISEEIQHIVVNYLLRSLDLLLRPRKQQNGVYNKRQNESAGSLYSMLLLGSRDL